MIDNYLFLNAYHLFKIVYLIAVFLMFFNLYILIVFHCYG
jgi:hypothetical protein